MWGKYFFLVLLLICSSAYAEGTVVIDSRMVYKKSAKCAQMDKMWGDDFKRRDPALGPKALGEATVEHDKREVVVMAELKARVAAYLAERGYKKVLLYHVLKGGAGGTPAFFRGAKRMPGSPSPDHFPVRARMKSAAFCAAAAAKTTSRLSSLSLRSQPPM